MQANDYKTRLKLARLRGEGTAKDYGFTDLPVDPFAIANQLDIEVRGKAQSVAGVSGMLLRHGDNFGIMYATNLNNEGYERFSVAHELGHYFMPGHVEQVLPSGNTLHESRGNFSSSDIYELEADHFAAGLLLPSGILRRKLSQFKDGLKAIEGLATLAKTSLIATAIAYVQATPCPALIAISQGGYIDYAFLSDSLVSVKGIEWIRKGDKLWERLFKAMAHDPDFEYAMIDSTIVRAHQHSAGAKGGLMRRKPLAGQKAG